MGIVLLSDYVPGSLYFILMLRVLCNGSHSKKLLPHAFTGAGE